MKYTITSDEDGSAQITVFHEGQTFTADSSHPYYDDIVKGVVVNNDPETVRFFDMTNIAADKFERLTERVLVAHGKVFFDGDEVNNVLTDQIIRFIREGEEDWKPLAAFMEKVMDNPVNHSREQLYNWLSQRAFTLTESGDIVAYKGVGTDSEGNYQSLHQGQAIVNGEVKNGNIPNPIGAIVEMPRSEVVHDPSNSCSYGLHVGTHHYARTYGSILLEVHVNPRDVVSVPTYDSGDKVRVCRYRVVGLAPDQAYEAAVLRREESDYDDYDEDWYDSREGDWDEIPVEDEYGSTAEPPTIDQKIKFNKFFG